MSKATQAQWVVGGYKGENAKLVLAHSAVGIGYQILQQSGSGGSLNVLAAFRCATLPLPIHLTPITDPVKVSRLEQHRKN